MADEKDSLNRERWHFLNGGCDAMALALAQVTGRPLGICQGVYEDDCAAPGERAWMPLHACVIVDEDSGAYLDARGLSRLAADRDRMIPPMLDVKIEEVVLVEASEQEVREAFSAQDASVLPEEIDRAMDFIRATGIADGFALSRRHSAQISDEPGGP